MPSATAFIGDSFDALPAGAVELVDALLDAFALEMPPGVFEAIRVGGALDLVFDFGIVVGFTPDAPDFQLVFGLTRNFGRVD